MSSQSFFFGVYQRNTFSIELTQNIAAKPKGFRSKSIFVTKENRRHACLLVFYRCHLIVENSIVFISGGGSGKYRYNLVFLFFVFARRVVRIKHVTCRVHEFFFFLTSTWTLLDNTVVHKSNCTVHGTSNRRRRCNGRVWRAPYVQRGKKKKKKNTWNRRWRYYIRCPRQPVAVYTVIVRGYIGSSVVGVWESRAVFRRRRRPIATTADRCRTDGGRSMAAPAFRTGNRRHRFARRRIVVIAVPLVRWPFRACLLLVFV